MEKKKVHLISQIHDVSQFSLTNLSTAKNNGSAYICHHGQSRLEIVGRMYGIIFDKSSLDKSKLAIIVGYEIQIK